MSFFIDTAIDSSKQIKVNDCEVINNEINKEKDNIVDEEEETYSVLCGDLTTVVMPKKKIETQEEIEARLRPVDRFIIPSMVYEFKPDENLVYIVGTQGKKVTKIAGLDHMVVLEELVLRSCLISSMEGVENLTTLTKLELYDNVIEEISCLKKLSNLTILDLSFNAIREIISLSSCPLLKELYIAQNKLRKIEGLEALIHLKTLDLGANRIRVIEGLENCISLESLWLGKNKIENISGVNQLSNLRQLDVQHNRLTRIDGITELNSLEELYLAFNAIENIDGLPISKLNTIDLTANPISSVNGIGVHQNLTDIWLTKSLLSTFESLEPLALLSNLDCLYLEHSPIASDFEYRMRLTKLIPSLTELDANNVNRNK